MSVEKKKVHEEVVSIVDVKQRVADGSHSMIIGIVGMALAFVVLLLANISDGFLAVFWWVILAIVILLNAAFFVRLWLVGDAEKRREVVGRSLTPETNKYEEDCNLSYDELRHRQEQQLADGDDGTSQH